MIDVSSILEKTRPKYIFMVVVFVSLINVSPQFYTEYKKSYSVNAMNADRTVRDVVQTLFYYNLPMLDGFRNLLYSKKKLTLESYSVFYNELLQRNWRPAFVEMNTEPYCEKNVGNWVESNIDPNNEMKNETFKIVTSVHISFEEKIIMLNSSLTSHSQKAGRSLKTHLKGIPQCEK